MRVVGHQGHDDLEGALRRQHHLERRGQPGRDLRERDLGRAEMVVPPDLVRVRDVVSRR
jgi:hypothetical protein